ncbi:SDR family oxidoreductase [Evansella sp. AB-P1]|uniref:UDP-glucuronic acid decarboxylase family protein n=1 Tax=Evansella sp. AB-P1 TaxID=3037653 RepID=UPI00241D55BB|nr:UDP-glucuronic acid decarboxylase family protein [Evansella sp. AB-P1]MDG5788343.1 SDR family oxidoreductase [Evansella sp. AB-P1]
MKKILITGGAGFLGSHLCRYLINVGHQIFCLDNFSTGSYNNIKNLLNHPRFSLVKHDITKEFHIDDPIDEIYNLASPASPIQYQIDPVKTLQTNVIGMNHVLELAKKKKARILQASTSEVYGDPMIHPQLEDYWGNVNPIGIRSCYDEGKRCAETLCFDYYRQYNVEIRVVRIFNTYGPFMSPNDGRVISNFIVQALSGKPITIYGDGLQTRSFCYVDDMILGMVAMMEKNELVGPVNIGNPTENTITEIAETIVSLTDSSSGIIYEKLPEDDPKKRMPDISLARMNLDWYPKISLQDGLNKTIAYFKHEDEKKNNAV